MEFRLRRQWLVPAWVGTVAAATVLVAATPGVAAAAAVVDCSATAVDLGSLGGYYSEARAVNAAGTVVGFSTQDGMRQTRAVRWQDGTALSLGLLASDPTSVSYAVDINDRGQIAGYSGTDSGEYHAFRWQAGTLTDLGTLGGTSSEPVGISDAGAVAGNSDTAAGQWHGFWWANGRLGDLGTLGGDTTRVVAVNRRGQVAGTSTRADGQPAPFRWQNGALTDLGRLGATGEVVGLNDRGHVLLTTPTVTGNQLSIWRGVGDVVTVGFPVSGGLAVLNDADQVLTRQLSADGSTAPVLWDPSGTVRVLPALDGGQAAPTSLNDRGQVAGSSIGPDAVSHAVVWENGVIVDLGTLGSYYGAAASAVDNHGHVIGSHSAASEHHAVSWNTDRCTR